MHGRLLAAAAFLAVALATPASAAKLYATDGTKLYTYGGTAPDTLDDPPAEATIQQPAVGGPVTFDGIDVDPATGKLYAIASDDHLYEVVPADGSTVDLGAITPALTGTALGMDINPVDGRVHVTTNDDKSVSFATDTRAAKDEPSSLGRDLVGTAFTNNVFGAATTAQYGIDAATGKLNALMGTWSDVGAGLGLGAPLNDAVGFDITGGGTAYAAFREGPDTKVREIDLVSGVAGAPVTLPGIPALTGITLEQWSVVNMATTTMTVNEGDPITVTVNRSGPLARAVDVGWGHTGGVGVGFGSVNWVAGIGGADTFSIPNPENTTDEPNRTVTAMLSTITDVAIPNATTTVTILDDDDPPVVTPPTQTQTTPAPTPPTQTTPTTTTPVVTPRPNPRPKLTVSRLGGRKLSDLTTRRGLTVKVKSNEACKLTAELRIPRSTSKKLIIGMRIARTSARLQRNKQATVKLRPVVQIRNKLKRLRSVKATVWLTCADNRGDADPPKTVATTLRR